MGLSVTKFKVGEAAGVGCMVDSCGTCKVRTRARTRARWGRAYYSTRTAPLYWSIFCLVSFSPTTFEPFVLRAVFFWGVLMLQRCITTPGYTHRLALCTCMPSNNNHNNNHNNNNLSVVQTWRRTKVLQDGADVRTFNIYC